MQIDFTDDDLIGRYQQAIEQKERAKREGGRANEFLVDMCDDAIKKLGAEMDRRGIKR